MSWHDCEGRRFFGFVNCAKDQTHASCMVGKCSITEPCSSPEGLGETWTKSIRPSSKVERQTSGTPGRARVNMSYQGGQAEWPSGQCVCLDMLQIIPAVLPQWSAGHAVPGGVSGALLCSWSSGFPQLPCLRRAVKGDQP